MLLGASKFVVHLINQCVVDEILVLELVTLQILENPTYDKVVVVEFIRECGSFLSNISPEGLHGIFEQFRKILHEGEIDKLIYSS